MEIVAHDTHGNNKLVQVLSLVKWPQINPDWICQICEDVVQGGQFHVGAMRACLPGGHGWDKDHDGFLLGHEPGKTSQIEQRIYFMLLD